MESREEYHELIFGSERSPSAIWISVNNETSSFSGIRFLLSSLFFLPEQDPIIIENMINMRKANLIIVFYYQKSLFRYFFVRNLTGYQAAQYPIKRTVPGTIIKSFIFITTGYESIISD